MPITVSSIGGVSTALSRVRAFALEKTGDEMTDRALARVADALRPILANPRLDQSTIRDVTFGAGVPKIIEHRLGRAFSGWAPARVRTNGATFVEVAQDASLDPYQVTITASAACTADLEIW